MPYLDSIHGRTLLTNIPWNVVDFETRVGPGPQEPIEIAIVPLLNGEIDKDNIYSLLIKPSQKIPEFAEARFSHITNDMLASAPCVHEIKPEIRRRLSSGVLIHHSQGNIDTRLASDHFSINLDRLYEFNTLKLSKLIHQNCRGHSLDAVHKRFRINFDNVCKRYGDAFKKLGVENPQRHRALPDALVTAEVFRKMLKKITEDHDITTFARFKRFYFQE